MQVANYSFRPFLIVIEATVPCPFLIVVAYERVGQQLSVRQHGAVDVHPYPFPPLTPQISSVKKEDGGCQTAQHGSVSDSTAQSLP